MSPGLTRPPTMPRRPHSAGKARASKGIALVIVLWVVVLLTVIVSSFVYNARGQVQLTGNLVARARAEALADAGVHRGLYEQFRPLADNGRWNPDGVPHELVFGEDAVTVTIIDESAYIDLNAAQDELLLGLLKSAGVEEGEAHVLLDAILDWRDADDLVRPSGAERDEYLASGLGYVPANAPFRTVDELKQVLGIQPEIYERIAGALTVHSRAPGVNAVFSPGAVLRALPGAQSDEVDAYLAAREADRQAGAPVQAFPPAAAFSGASTGVYNLQSLARLADGTKFVRVAVARLTGDPKHPVAYLDWKEGRP